MDYELQISIKNAPMLNRMREAGIYTAAELSRETSVSQSTIGEMLALKVPLYCQQRAYIHHEIKPRLGAVKIADRLGCSPEDLYPQSHWFSELEQSYFSAQIARHQMENLTHFSMGDPALMLEYLEEDASLDAREIIDSVDTITERDKKILYLRFEEGKTYREIGKIMGITGERVRKLELRSLSKMRKPNVAERLKKHLTVILK